MRKRKAGARSSTNEVNMFQLVGRVPTDGAGFAPVIELLGRTNSVPYRGFGPGEVMFLGASCPKNKPGAEVTYRFAVCARTVMGMPLEAVYGSADFAKLGELKAEKP